MVNGKFQFLYATEFWCRMSKHGADQFMCKDGVFIRRCNKFPLTTGIQFLTPF